ncbi:hypothetical protein BJV74DRAFT_841109 [Russula compacta]|nr:hypothetical protein BJV74DRAFT_841109 [Russula compacta]
MNSKQCDLIDGATCPICRQTESLQHILLECNAPARSLIWHQAKELWPHDPQDWPEISLGTILGAGSVSLPENEGPIHIDPSPTSLASRGKTRLLQILITEASHLIWVLRCDRTINQETHSEQQTKNRWLKKINERLTTDMITALKIKRGTHTIELTNATWEKALEKQGKHLANWLITNSGY